MCIARCARIALSRKSRRRERILIAAGRWRQRCMAFPCCGLHCRGFSLGYSITLQINEIRGWCNNADTNRLSVRIRYFPRILLVPRAVRWFSQHYRYRNVRNGFDVSFCAVGVRISCTVSSLETPVNCRGLDYYVFSAWFEFFKPISDAFDHLTRYFLCDWRVVMLQSYHSIHGRMVCEKKRTGIWSHVGRSKLNLFLRHSSTSGYYKSTSKC